MIGRHRWTSQKRMTEVGPRIQENQSDTYQVTVGVRGTVLGDWDFDAYAQHGEGDQTMRQSGNVRRSKVEELTYAPDGGQSLCAGGFNPFGIGALTAECAAYVSVNSRSTESIRQTVAEASVRGSPLTLPPGELRTAFGVMYRDESYQYRADDLLRSYLPDGLPDNAGVHALTTSTARTTTSISTPRRWCRSSRTGRACARSRPASAIAIPTMRGSACRHLEGRAHLPAGREPAPARLVPACDPGAEHRRALQPADTVPGRNRAAGSLQRRQRRAHWPGSRPASRRCASRRACRRHCCRTSATPDGIYVDGLYRRQSGSRARGCDDPHAGRRVPLASRFPALGGPAGVARLVPDRDRGRDQFRVRRGVHLQLLRRPHSIPTYAASNHWCSNFGRDADFRGRSTTRSRSTRNLAVLETSGIDLQLNWNIDVGRGELGVAWYVGWVDSFERQSDPDVAGEEQVGTIGGFAGAYPEWKWNFELSYARRRSRPDAASGVMSIRCATSISRITRSLQYDCFDLYASYTVKDGPLGGVIAERRYREPDGRGAADLSDAGRMRIRTPRSTTSSVAATSSAPAIPRSDAAHRRAPRCRRSRPAASSRRARADGRAWRGDSASVSRHRPASLQRGRARQRRRMTANALSRSAFRFCGELSVTADCVVALSEPCERVGFADVRALFDTRTRPSTGPADAQRAPSQRRRECRARIAGRARTQQSARHPARPFHRATPRGRDRTVRRIHRRAGAARSTCAAR